MTKKSRIKNDPFDWVDSLTDKPKVVSQNNTLTRSKREPHSKVEKTKSASEKAKPEPATVERQKGIFVAFKIDTGEIMAIQELMLGNANDSDISWPVLPQEMKAQLFKLTGELADKELIEIHSNYKVTESGKLELKQR